MAFTVKSRSPKVYIFGDGEMVGTNHLVYNGKARVGTVLETTCDGKHWYEAEHIYNDFGRQRRKSIMNGQCIAHFDTLEAALVAIEEVDTVAA